MATSWVQARRTPYPSAHTHTHTRFLSHAVLHTDPNTHTHTHSQRCWTCQPCNHQQVTADTKRSRRRLVLSGVTAGGSGGEEEEEKDEGDNAKISSLWERDRWPHARGLAPQIIWQRPVCSPHLFLHVLSRCHVLFFLFITAASKYPNFCLCWISVQLSIQHVDWCWDPGEKIKTSSGSNV